MENKQTAVDTLFEIFKLMSNNMRDAGDDKFANILEYLYKEYRDKTLVMEKKQIMEAYEDGKPYYIEKDISMISSEQYYEETYGTQLPKE